MFADLRGVTRLAERLYAFDSVFLLNRYFEVMEQAIRRHAGVVDKFLGDGVMALFGATSTPERGSRDALLAVGAMLEVIEGLNAEFHTTLPEPLRMGIRHPPGASCAWTGRRRARARSDGARGQRQHRKPLGVAQQGVRLGFGRL